MWVKTEGKILDHPKIMEAGPYGFALFMAGLGFCAEHLTDGEIPEAALRILGAKAWADSHAEAMETAEELVAIGLWEQGPRGFVVHDYLVYQPSRAYAEELKKTRAAAGARGGSKPKAKRQAKTEASALANADQFAEQKGKPVSRNRTSVNRTPESRKTVPEPERETPLRGAPFGREYAPTFFDDEFAPIPLEDDEEEPAW